MSELRKGQRVREIQAPEGCRPYTGRVEYVTEDGWTGVRLDLMSPVYMGSGRVISARPGEVEPIADTENPARAALRHHVTGAIERGEAEAITEQHTQWTVSARFAAVGSTVRVWDVLRDGVVIDTFENQALADAYATYCQRRIDPATPSSALSIDPHAVGVLTWKTRWLISASVRAHSRGRYPSGPSGDTGKEYGPTRLDMYAAHAYERGQSDALAVSTWVTDGNDTDESRRLKLAALTDGDPAGDALMPEPPNLSGEWSDGASPLSLARTITGEDGPEPDLIDALADAYEAGVSETFSAACEAELRRWIPSTVERMTELRAEIDDARKHGRDPQRQLCELSDLAETEEGAAFAEFADALAHFQHETERLARAWQDVSGDILGDSYGLPESFDYYAATISAWTVQR